MKTLLIELTQLQLGVVRDAASLISKGPKTLSELPFVRAY